VEASAPNRVGPKRLMRSSIESKIAGVCGGLAEYFGVDPGITRIAMTLNHHRHRIRARDSILYSGVGNPARGSGDVL